MCLICGILDFVHKTLLFFPKKKKKLIQGLQHFFSYKWFVQKQNFPPKNSTQKQKN